ncbi:MAG: BatD family protein [Ignavibacteria bacterium]|nr:BatD family protein [Ignavibacteria bacterium]
MIKQVILILFASILTFNNLLAEYRFTASASSTTVRVGEQIQITFTLNTTNGRNFQAPSFKGFSVLAGPSQSMRTQIVNGQISSSLSFTYILLADAEGTFTIEPAKINVEGSTLSSNPLTIKVLKADEKSKSEKEESTESGKTISQQADEILRNNLFIKLFTDKNQVYLGETIVATYKLYVHKDLNIVNISVPKMPTFNGFWAQDFEIKQLNFTTEVINGTPFKVADLKQVVLIPQQSGNLTIESMEIDFVVRLLIQQQKKRYRDPFDILFDDPFFNDPFFTNRYKDFPFTVKSKPTTIKVLPLPTPQPPEFTGAVGSLQMKAWLDKDKVRTGDIVTLKVQLIGKGNLKLLNPPPLNIPADFDLYEPKIIDNTNVTPSGISGNITFEYYLIPKNPGQFKIEPFKYAYFDPKMSKYINLTSNHFILNVEGNPTAQAFVTNVRKEEIKYLGQDIRYIKTNAPNFNRASESFLISPLFFILILLPTGFWFGFFYYVRKRNSLENNAALFKQKKAMKIAKKYLQKAKDLISENSKDRFYEETSKALWSFVSNKLNIPPTELTKENIRERLIQAVKDEELVEKFIALLMHCEEARYSPNSNSQPLQDVYEYSIDILSNISKKTI